MGNAPHENIRMCDIKILIASSLALMWSYWLNTHSYWLLPDYWYLHAAGFEALACLVFIALGRKRCQQWSRIFDVTFGVLGGASAAVIGFANSTSLNPIPCLLATCISGICIGWIHLRCLLQLASLDPIRAFTLVCLASIASSVLGMSLSFIIEPVNTLTGVLLSLVSSYLVKSLGFPEARKSTSPSRKQSNLLSLMAGPMLCLFGLRFIYSAVNTLLKGNYGSFVYGPKPVPAIAAFGELVSIAGIALVLWWVIKKKQSIDFFTLLKIPIVLLTVALAMVGFLGDSPYLQIATLATSCFLTTCLWLAIVDVIQNSDFDGFLFAAAMLAIEHFTYYLARCPLYWLLFIHFPDNSSLSSNAALSLLAALILLLVCTVRSQSQAMRTMFFTINNTPVDDASHDEIASKCQELGTRYGLSGREMEIAQYIAKGYSKPYIAEALYISDSTVRTHTKRLYEKLDVHSRQELQEKIGMGIKN